MIPSVLDRKRQGQRLSPFYKWWEGTEVGRHKDEAWEPLCYLRSLLIQILANGFIWRDQDWGVCVCVCVCVCVFMCVCLGVLGFELRVLHLIVRHCTT
jgi:hypothetical protein